MPSRALVSLSVTLLAALAMGATWLDDADDGETSLALESLPAAVRAAFERTVPNGVAVTYSSEHEHDGLVFEAEWQHDGQTHELEVDAQGVLLESSESLDAASAPAAVLRSVGRHAAAGRALHVERHTFVLYEVSQDDAESHEWLVSPDGRFAELEYGSAPDDDEHDEDGDDDEHDGDDEHDDDR